MFYRKAAVILLLSTTLCGCARDVPVQPYLPRDTVVLDILCPEEEWDIVTELCGDFAGQHRESSFAFTLDIPPADVAGALLSGSVKADVLCFRSDMTGELVTGGVLLPLTEQAESIRDSCIPPSVSAVRVGGELYGVPYSAETDFLYYDRRRFTEHDVESLNAMLLKPYYVAVERGSCPMAEKLAEGSQADGRLRCESDGRAIKAGFVSGSISAAICGIEYCDEIRSTLGRSFGAAPLPTVTYSDGTKPLQSYSVYSAVGVCSLTTHPKEAAQLAMWLGGEEAQRLRLSQLGSAPVAMPLCTDKQLMREYPEISALLSQLNNSLPSPQKGT